MRRAFLPVLALAVLLMPAPASAVPLCVPGTIADYVALATGCRSGGVTVSDFFFDGSGGSALDLLVTPAPGVSLGSLRLILSIGASLDVPAIRFTATADSPVIHKLGLAFAPTTVNDFSTAFLNGVGIIAFLDTPPRTVFGEATMAFPPVAVKDFNFFFDRGTSSNPTHVALDVVTPEPATLLLWGTGAAGLGVVRWLKRRRGGTSLTP